MNSIVDGSTRERRSWRYFFALLLIATLLATIIVGPAPTPTAQAQGPLQFPAGTNPAQLDVEEQIEQAWKPAYLSLATGDPNGPHGIYDWPFDLDSIGWSMQSYQDYGGTPYFHHGMDMMKIYGTMVYNRSGGQVINIENYQPGWDLYWEVAILDPEGYIWQYHHIQMETIPQLIWDKFHEWQVDPVNGGFIPANTHIGNIIEWPVWSFGKQFNHIHLNILAEGGVFVNGFAFHNPLPDTVGPQIQAVGLLQYGQVHPGNDVDGSYSLYVRANDLILDTVYYLPPWDITFSTDGGPEHTTWQFNQLPGGADDTAYLDDFYVVPPTCGDYECRDYYIDLGFIPNSQYQFPCSGGPHSIQVTVRDYAGNEATQLFNYTVINHPPVANPQSVTTPEDTPRAIVLTGSDQNCDELSFSVESGPSHGTLGGVAPNLVYTPTANYHGTDSFTFVVSDGLAVSPPATVNINVTSVNDPPVADPQSVTTPMDTGVLIILTGSDVENDPLTFSVQSDPSHGTLSGTPPNLLYWPDTGYMGPDAFTFIVNDGSLDSEPATVDITVEGENNAPVADPQVVTTTEDTALDIVLTGSDPDGDPLTFSVETGPGHGVLGGIAPNLTYTPTADYYGADSFTFSVSDGLYTSGPATVGITVQAVNDAPVADAQAVTTTEDTSLDIVLTGSDVDGDPLAFGVETGPGHGILGGTAPTLTYTPTADYYGADSFTFVVSDGLAASAPAVVSITVQAVNDAPVADAQAVTAVPGQSVAITLTGSDIEGSALTFTVVVTPSHGTLSGTAPYLTYTPALGYGGPDTFAFIVNDGELDSEPATVTINVGWVIYLPMVVKS